MLYKLFNWLKAILLTSPKNPEPLGDVTPTTPESKIWWTIQVFYDAQDDDGKKFRGTSCYWTQAIGVQEAYAEAGKALGEKYKLGAIVPGQHMRFP